MIRDNVLISAGIQVGMLEEATVAEFKLLARRQRVDVLEMLSVQLRFPIANLHRAYAQVHGYRFLDSDEITIDPLLLRKISPAVIEKRMVIPLQSRDEGGESLLLVGNPDDYTGTAQVLRSLPPDIEICMTDPRLLQQLVQRVIQSASDTQPLEFDPVSQLDALLKEAYLNGASDIHLEPGKDSFKVRLRMDGSLQPYMTMFSAEQGIALMSRMKVLNGMDISEQRMPQDGGMTYQLDQSISFDIRAATIPIKFGERATLRLLGTDSDSLSLKSIGFSPISLARFSVAIKKPHGMILITGPTGSGKSTTLYSALGEIVSKEINVMTAEDPIEYVMDGISQVQVGAKVTFASALRSFLRHDPDVIMVGEIRDAETAGIAMKASLTGHMVFSTLHTNSAVSTISRLVDIGVEPFLIGSTLECIIAQRLVKRLCSHCKKAMVITDKERTLLCLPQTQHPVIYCAVGCAHCHQSGYKGRTALFETLWIDDDLAPLIGAGANELEIRAAAKDFVSLAADCRDKILLGLTCIAEFRRLSLRIEPGEIVSASHCALQKSEQ